MTTFTNNDVNSGATIFASDHNTQGSLIAAVLNGGIDNGNINASAAIATSKLADDAGITTAKITDAAITTAKLNDGAVTPAKLVAGTGTTWAGVATWSPTLVGFSANPTGVYRYTVVGKTVTLYVNHTTNGTSNATSFTISLPFTAATVANISWTNTCQVVDNGSSSIGICWIDSAGTVLNIGTSGKGGLTASGNKRTLGLQITYEVP